MHRHKGSKNHAPKIEHTVVADDGALQQTIEQMLGDLEGTGPDDDNPEPYAGRYAIDTEFHRENTYYPQLALIQIHWRDRDGHHHNRLIDPLQVEPKTLRTLLETDLTAVTHAAEQDLEVLQHHVGCIPSRIFDTQLAAGFLGYSTPSLSSLAAGMLNVKLDKSDRLTDWLARPLSGSQIHYALNDVVHLPDIVEKIETQLRRKQRYHWAQQACEDLRVRPRTSTPPEEAWRRIKDLRTLTGPQRNIAVSLAAWRERHAMETDKPPRRILSDLTLLAIAQQNPNTIEQLQKIRQIGKAARPDIGQQILRAVKDGREQPVIGAPARIRNDRNITPAVTLMLTWLADFAHHQQIDPTLIATRDDIERFALTGTSTKILNGWRAELLGDTLQRINRGEIALAVDQHGNVITEQRTI